MAAGGVKADDVAALQQIARQFEEGFNSGDVDRIMRYYGERYVDVNLRNPVQTWEERREYYRRVGKGLKVRVRPEEIRVEGEWGFVRGSLEVRRPGAENPIEMRYLEIARKQPDGTWQVVWGMDGPVQEYDPKA